MYIFGSTAKMLDWPAESPSCLPTPWGENLSRASREWGPTSGALTAYVSNHAPDRIQRRGAGRGLRTRQCHRGKLTAGAPRGLQQRDRRPVATQATAIGRAMYPLLALLEALKESLRSSSSATAAGRTTLRAGWRTCTVGARGRGGQRQIARSASGDACVLCDECGPDAPGAPGRRTAQSGGRR